MLKSITTHYVNLRNIYPIIIMIIMSLKLMPSNVKYSTYELMDMQRVRLIGIGRLVFFQIKTRQIVPSLNTRTTSLDNLYSSFSINQLGIHYFHHCRSIRQSTLPVNLPGYKLERSAKTYEYC